jgi:hypothetical protein
MKISLIVATATLFGAAHSAEAATLIYTLQGNDASRFTASFTLGTERAPSIVLSDSVRYNGVPITFTRPNGTTVQTAALANTGPTFRTLGNQGGLFLGSLGGFPTSFQVFGPQLFSGPTSAPQFLTGTFGLSDIPRSRTTDPLIVNYTLTVSQAVSAVPEPSTWAMMLVGFGFIGSTMRSAKRRRKLSVTYA